MVTYELRRWKWHYRHLTQAQVNLSLCLSATQGEKAPELDKNEWINELMPRPFSLGV
jgi:hypothetical protein